MEKFLIEKHYPKTGTEIKLTEKFWILFSAHPTFSYEDSDEEAEWLHGVFQEIKTKYPQETFQTLIDVSAVGNSEDVSENARETFSELLKDKQVKKVAVFGQTWGFQLILDLIATLSSTKKLKTFSSKEKAIEWLNK